MEIGGCTSGGKRSHAVSIAQESTPGRSSTSSVTQIWKQLYDTFEASVRKQRTTETSWRLPSVPARMQRLPKPETNKSMGRYRIALLQLITAYFFNMLAVLSSGRGLDSRLPGERT